MSDYASQLIYKYGAHNGYLSAAQMLRTGAEVSSDEGAKKLLTFYAEALEKNVRDEASGNNTFFKEVS